MSSRLRVLVVEDSVDDTFFIVRELQRGGWEVDFERVETHETMAAALEQRPWDLVISDYSMPLFGGGPALGLFVKSGQDIPFIMVSGALGEDVAVEMVKRGAHDYVNKNKLAELGPGVKRELEAARERRARRQSEAGAAYLAALVQSCQDPILGLSLQGEVVSCNPAAQTLFGYGSVELIGQPFASLLVDGIGSEFPQILERLRKGEHPARVRAQVRCKMSEQAEASLTISPVRNAAGALIGASVVAHA
jgi:PAS domain S-box-containing protein